MLTDNQQTKLVIPWTRADTNHGNQLKTFIPIEFDAQRYNQQRTSDLSGFDTTYLGPDGIKLKMFWIEPAADADKMWTNGVSRLCFGSEALSLSLHDA